MASGLELSVYLGTTAGGFEHLLVKELAVDPWVKLSTSIVEVFQGGVVFQTQAPVQVVLALRSADNVYAHLLHLKGLPVEKETGLEFLNSVAYKIDWERPLALFDSWRRVLGQEAPSGDRHEGAADVVAGPGREECREGTERLSFRVTCYRVCIKLKAKQGYSSAEAAAAIGEGVHELHGWPGKMCHFDVEVLAWIHDDDLLMALGLLYSNLATDSTGEAEAANDVETVETSPTPPAACEHVLPQSPKGKAGSPPARDIPGVVAHGLETRKPRPKQAKAHHKARQLFARRAYREELVMTSLRPSIAHGLLGLVNLQPGDIVLDPMCGCGTIPLEASDCLGSKIASLAGDINPAAVEAARVNATCRGALQGGDGVATPAWSCDVALWDGTRLPLRDACVDAIVSDMPFGNRCGTHKMREKVCPRVLAEVARILRPGSGRAALLSQSKSVRSELLRPHIQTLLSTTQSFTLDMEGMKVDVFVLQRSHVVYVPPASSKNAESKRRAKMERKRLHELQCQLSQPATKEHDAALHSIH